MLPWAALLLATPPAAPSPAPVLTRFEEVAPPLALPEKRSDTAVVLIHGLLFRPHVASEAALQDWQQPGSTLVNTLSGTGDVWAFAYAEGVSVEAIAAHPDLAADIARVLELGYARIVLVGHSAGGVVAREFVEDHPDAGVSEVIQVCAPNQGARLGGDGVQTRLLGEQRPFFLSLGATARAETLTQRADKHPPDKVAFVCFIGDDAGVGDGILGAETQWPADLRALGIPMVMLHTTHLTVMRTRSAAEKIAQAVASPPARWDADQVEKARKTLRPALPRLP